MMRGIHRLAATGLILVSASATGQGPRLAVLGSIMPGMWQLRELGGAPGGKPMCVRDPGALLQVRHTGLQCARFVVADTPRAGTIQYTCPGQGNGRTTITIESESLLRLKTQGIANGAPFDFDYEARRTGACGDAR